MIITETGRGHEIVFDYKPHIVRELKAMYGVRFQGKEKGWFIPFVGNRKNPDGTTTNLSNKEAIEKFKAKYLTVAPGADAAEQMFKIEDLPDLKIELPWKKGVKPFGYQDKGIARGMELKRFINGDMPGTGKTIQSIGTCLALEASGNNPFPCLIVCPATLKENWRREIEDKFSNKRAIILHDKNRNTWHQYYRMGMADFFIVNYESLWSYFVIGTTQKKGASITLKDIQFNPLISMFKAVIFDEGHKLRNTQTKTSKVARGITAGKEIVMLLTGTPVVNQPKDLAAILAIIGRLGEFGGYRFFLDRYCQGGSGAANLAELNGKMNKLCFFRREKKDVLKELPDKMREVFTCDITTQAEYNAAKRDLGTYLKEQGYSEKQVNKSMNAEIMVKIGKLKAISARGKLPMAIEHIQEIVDAGEKIVVFINGKAMANSLMEAFPGSVSVRGTEIDELTGKEKPQSLDARQRSVDAFQNDPSVNVIVCSIKAAGVGITLTASSRLMFLELPWHPADVEQCEDRCIAAGQLIPTIDGFKKIEDVAIGDRVYSASGIWREVTDKWSKLERNKSFVEIKYKGFSEPLYVTEDHRVMVYNIATENTEYIEAGSIHINKHKLVFANPFQHPLSNPVTQINIPFEFGNDFLHRNGTPMSNSRVVNPCEVLYLNEDVMYAFGWYMAEGWSKVSKSRESGSFAAICGNKTTESEKVRTIAQKILTAFQMKDVKFSIHTNDKNCISAYIYSKNLANLFKNLFGSGSENKKIPDFVFDCSESFQKEFLKGYFEGDGYRRGATQQASTKSDKIAFGLSRLCAKLGYPITLRKATWGGWSFEYSIRELCKRETLIKNTDQYVLFPIEKITHNRPSRGKERVYDLTVKNDHSFTVGLSAVHNCHRVGQKNSVQISYFLGKDTIDEDIYKMIEKKREVSDAITGTTTTIDTMITDLTRSLFNQK